MPYFKIFVKHFGKPATERNTYQIGMLIKLTNN
jgi:hypothetical protein